MTTPATPSQFYYSHHYSQRNQPASMKIKAILQDHVFPHVCYVVRALNKVGSKLMDYVRWKYVATDLFVVDASSMCRKKMGVVTLMVKKTKKKEEKNTFRSSFRMCCNWHSSHVLPITPPEPETSIYYDSSWNSVICSEEGGVNVAGEDEIGAQLSGYLQWLDDKNQLVEEAVDDGDEIDRLAEMFIAKCHEKFRLEKQESYRRYQEMLARSM